MAHPLVLDTDIGTDVDDALALAFAVRHPDIELVAVTTVSGDTLKRAQIAAKLLRLAGRGDVEVAAGIGDTGPPDAGSAWMGHEGRGLLEPGEELPISERDGVEVLLRTCASDTNCEVATIGMQTNVAAALRRDERLAQRVRRLAVMGGVFSPIVSGGKSIGPEGDHNLRVDPGAAVHSLNAGMRLLYVPLDVTLETYLTRAQVERLRQGDDLCRALAKLCDIWAPILHGFTDGRLPPDHVAVMHDPLTVATLVDERFVTIEELPVTVVAHHDEVRTFVDPVAGRPAEVVTSVAPGDFGEFWLETVLD